MRSVFDNPAFEDDSPSSILNSSQPPDIRQDTPLASPLINNDLEMIEVPKLATEKLEENYVNAVNGGLPASRFQDSSQPTPSRMPPPAFDENAALIVRNAHKSYRKGTPVLSNFNMTVPTGTIYSLLGSSGCGKTTMLSCCVGIRQLDQGEIFVFGHRPGSKESGVPGGRIGFMPQELSLFGELTIQEALNFYGRIYGMKRSQIFESTRFLVDFLDLPPASRKVGSLSGGQKRRVSISLALIHNPELIVLDEPTVGLDPLLRESIWNHLVKLVTSGGVTVIITTHYVEEARQSNVIGIMRNGRLLTEKSPQALLDEFKVPHLEDIVLSLCRADREERRNSGLAKDIRGKHQFPSISKWFIKEEKVDESTTVEDDGVIGIRYETTPPISGAISTNGDNNNMHVTDPSAPQLLMRRRMKSTPESRRLNQSTTSRRLLALLIKNFIILIRNVGFLLFVFLVPSIQVVLICLTIGSDPKGLLIGVINPEPCDFEGENWRQISETCPVESQAGEETQNASLSCFYLSQLPIESFILEREDSVVNALQRIQKGYIYGYVQFPKNYTNNVLCLFGSLCINHEEIGSNIIMELDMSNKQIGQTMKRIFVDAYVKSMEVIKKNCRGKVSELALKSATNVPYTFKKPVYGKDDTSFREFLAPSILLGLLFFFPLCSSGVSYITEKKTGTLDRALVAGVGTTELMAGFLISQVGILLGQAGFAFLILTQVFQIQILGSISLALFLTILVGISGMSAGFLIAMFCSEEVQAVLLAIGTFFPNILLAGMVWPLEGMDQTLQYVSYLLPCTLACESMRSIISRGWTLGHRSVWPGFLSTFAWITVYWVLAVLVHKFRNKG